MPLMDAVAIDDRALNRHGSHGTREQGLVAIPIVCSLDVVEHLHETNSLADTDRSNAYFRLRASGFNVAPINPDEPSTWSTRPLKPIPWSKRLRCAR